MGQHRLVILDKNGLVDSQAEHFPKGSGAAGAVIGGGPLPNFFFRPTSYFLKIGVTVNLDHDYSEAFAVLAMHWPHCISIVACAMCHACALP